MYYCNITFSIDPEVFELWQQWIEQKHLVWMRKTISFKSAKFIRVCTDDSQSLTYCIQYEFDNLHLVSDFQEKYMATFQHLLFIEFGQRVLSFVTGLQELKTFDYF